MKRKVKDWREEGYNIGDKLFMTSFSYFGRENSQDVYISHIGKTVIKVKPDLNKDYEISFRKGLRHVSELGLCYNLYESKESYEELKAQIEYRDKLVESARKVISRIPNKELEDLIAKYGDKE